MRSLSGHPILSYSIAWLEATLAMLWGYGESHVINLKSVSHHHITLPLNSNLFPFWRSPSSPAWRRATVRPVSKRRLSAEHQTSVYTRQMVFDQRNSLLLDAQDLVTVYTDRHPHHLWNYLMPDWFQISGLNQDSFHAATKTVSCFRLGEWVKQHYRHSETQDYTINYSVWSNMQWL